jgi:hypothetical protein
MQIKPIFIISLPRSGSTLLQRIIATNKEVHTVSETWLLLPFLFCLKKEGQYSKYWHRTTNKAIGDFIGTLPNKNHDFFEATKNFALDLYLKSSSGNKYFLEKTPRYNLILSEILQVFPDGKFILLVRNPVSIMNSIINTWGKGSWNLYKYKVDLYEGFDNMINCFSTNYDKFLLIKYEDILENSNYISMKLEKFLGIQITHESFKNFSKITLSGRYGDPIGIKKFKNISIESKKSWNKKINPLRKILYKRYIKWIGKEKLKLIGYDFDEVIGDINKIPLGIKYLFLDSINLILGVIICFFDGYSMYDKLKNIPNMKKIYFQK